MNIDIEKLNFDITKAEFSELDSRWKTELFFPASRILRYTRLYLPLEGEGCVTDGDRQYFLRRGKMLLVPSYANVKVSCETFLKKYWVHFNALIPETNVDVFLLIGGCIELDVSGDLDHYRWLFERIVASYSRSFPGTLPLVRFEAHAALSMLLTPFLRQCFPLESQKALPKLVELLYYIDRNIHRKMTLKELSTVACLHPNYLSAIFRKRMSLSLFEYINRQRIAHALKYLRSNELTISEIADHVGITNVQIFSKLFKKFHDNFSPRQYRRLIMEEIVSKNHDIP